MLHTKIIPQTTDIHIAIPQDYVGRKLELLLYAADEAIDINAQTEDTPTMSAFRGILSKEKGNELLAYLQQSRDEWL